MTRSQPDYCAQFEYLPVDQHCYDLQRLQGQKWVGRGLVNRGILQENQVGFNNFEESVMPEARTLFYSSQLSYCRMGLVAEMRLTDQS